MYSAYRYYPPFGLSPNVFLFAEIPVQKACESLAVTGFVTRHFMNGVVNCIKVKSLCTLCQIGLACGCAVFGFDTHLKVLFGAGSHNFAEKFCKLCSMLSLFIGCFSQ